MSNFLSVIYLILVTLVLPSAIAGALVGLVGVLLTRRLRERRSSAARGLTVSAVVISFLLTSSGFSLLSALSTYAFGYMASPVRIPYALEAGSWPILGELWVRSMLASPTLESNCFTGNEQACALAHELVVSAFPQGIDLPDRLLSQAAGAVSSLACYWVIRLLFRKARRRPGIAGGDSTAS